MMLRWLFAIAAVAVLAVYIVRPLVRMLRRQPDAELVTPDFSHLLEGEELEIPSEGEAGFDRDSAITQARADPRATAILVQRWLKERR